MVVSPGVGCLIYSSLVAVESSPSPKRSRDLTINDRLAGYTRVIEW